MKIWSVLGGSLIRPGKTFRALGAEPGGSAAGGRVMTLAGALFALTAAGLAAGGALTIAPPFLNISPENYYAVEMVFALPVFFLTWLAGSALAFLLSRRRGEGTFEGLSAALAAAVAVPSFLIWIPEAALAVALLLGVKQAEIMAFTARPGLVQSLVLGGQLVAALWMVFLTIVAVRAVRRVGRLRAVATGFLTAVVMLAILIVFIR